MPTPRSRVRPVPRAHAVSVARSGGPEENVNTLVVPEALRYEVPPQRLARDRSFGDYVPSTAQVEDWLAKAWSLHSNRYNDSTVENWSERVRFIIVIGQLSAPTRLHDHGFLAGPNAWEIDDSKREAPTDSDHASKAMWVGINAAAATLRPDLWDACEAYHHFLFGLGASREVDYESFIVDDKAGKKIEQSIFEDTYLAAVRIHDFLVALEQKGGSMLAGGAGANSTFFVIQSELIQVGWTRFSGRYPNPGTENWQKSIGEHPIWIDAEVGVANQGGLRHFSIEITVYLEDMYNFNPGQNDEATSIPDAWNGRFEIVGLGHEYLNRATIFRHMEFAYGLAPMPEFSDAVGPFQATTPARGGRGRTSDSSSP